MTNETRRNPLETTTKTYSVPEWNLSELKRKIERIARRCTKLGLPAITIEVGAAEDRAYTFGIERNRVWLKTQEQVDYAKGLGDRVHYMRFFSVTLTGQTPRLAGWEFLATLQHLEVDGEIANMLRVVPGHEGNLPKQFRTASPENCDHCRKTIRTRKETFVVRNEETNEYKQVGRNCTQDFLGGMDPHSVISMLELIQQADAACGGAEEDGWGGGGGIVERTGLEAFLLAVTSCIRVGGWMSRTKAKQAAGELRATADEAWLLLFPPEFRGENAAQREAEYRKWAEARTATDDDKAVVEKAIAYAHEDLTDKKEDSDYLYNLWIAVNQVSVDQKLSGIVASLVPHYLKEVERRVIREMERKQVANSQHLGKAKDRLLLTVTVLQNRASDAGYSIIKMVTDDGNALVWFGSGGMEVGKTYFVKATVKRHSEFKGVKETAVNRVEIYTEEQFKAEKEKEAKKAVRAAKKAAKLAAEAAKKAAEDSCGDCGEPEAAHAQGGAAETCEAADELPA